MTRLAFLSLPALLLALTGCQTAPPAPPPTQQATLACPAGTDPWQRLEIVFGRDMQGGGRVSDKAWRSYVQQVLSPAFPDGLSVVEAEGRWVSPTGQAYVEDSFVVLIYQPADASPSERIDAVVADYKKRFQQESVLVSANPACLAFK
ncbi:MAG TPA: DUF3574 domain-containing protein [Kiloniellales bacterium]|nr:DUF3574 domain-containing protein [Kiloniellales bacterium]